MTYTEKLKDPLWQRRRLEILQRDNFTCRECSATTETLHVHHKRYRRKLDPWEYSDGDLITLCASCHHKLGELKEMIGACLHRQVLRDAFWHAYLLIDSDQYSESIVSLLAKIHANPDLIPELLNRCKPPITRQP